MNVKRLTVIERIGRFVPTGASHPAPDRQAHLSLLLAVVLLTVFVIPISVSGTAIAIPSISRDLGTSPTGLQWVINGFNVSFAVFTLVWGVASDRIGYRATFVWGPAIILAASALSALAPSLLILDIARVLAGAGGAAVLAGAAALLSNAFEGASRGRAFALFGTTLGLSLALGPTIAGGIVSGVGWRGVFGLVGAFMVLSLLGSPLVPKVEVERPPGTKAIDFSSLKNKKFLAMVLVPVAAAFGFVTVLSYLPVALSAVHGLSAGTTGLVILPMTVPVFIGPIASSWLISHFRGIGPMTMMNVSLALLILGDVGLLFLSPSASIGALVVPMLLLGFGFGLPVGLVDGEALAAVPPKNSGTAAGVLNFMRFGSEAVAVIAYAAILAALLHSKISNPAVAQAVAAGATGHGATYASEFHLIVVAMAILTAIFTVLINLLHAAHSRHAGEGEPAGPPTAVPEEAGELRADPLA
jgi:MFS family permease